jgi:hypothetical protein
VEYHENEIRDLNDKITQTEPKQPIYLFGAHIFSQYLIGFGLNTGRIAGLLDNALSKQEKRLYGTSLKVNSPKILADTKNPIVILKAATYNTEIKDDILKNINPNVTFWE